MFTFEGRMHYTQIRKQAIQTQQESIRLRNKNGNIIMYQFYINNTTFLSLDFPTFEINKFMKLAFISQHLHNRNDYWINA